MRVEEDKKVRDFIFKAGGWSGFRAALMVCVGGALMVAALLLMWRYP
jgi:hypothetical protein